MTSIITHRSSEPLYIVILHNTKQADTIFKEWIKVNRIENAQVSGHRMMIHDQQTFEKLRITWKHGTDMLTIWDTWKRRHLYLE